MFQRVVIYLIFSVIALFTISCSSYSKIQKSQDFRYKYTKAIEYYDRGDYFKALNLFDQVIPFYRGTKEAEDIAYKYGYAYYNQEEYIMASYYFDRFAKTYPRTERAEECMFMVPYCKYLDSPKYRLDQTNTRQAINDFQLFINAYPMSDRVEECNALIDELRLKLQKKEVEIAKLYLKMEKYEAAVVSFENLLLDYPDTPFREEAMFYSIKAYYYYAHKSVRSKKIERYQEASDIYNQFIVMYPESEYNKHVEYMYEKATKEINRINK